jgi:hypothetical protein
VQLPLSLASADDGAEVLRIHPAALAFGERAGHSRGDADAGVAVGAVEDVGAVAGGGHPRFHDRTRSGVPQCAPGDVLAELVPVVAAWDEPAGADAHEQRLAAGAGVFEVVAGHHVVGVGCSRPHEQRIHDQRRIAVAGAFAVDQAQRRGAHAFEVFRSGFEIGSRAHVRGGGGLADARLAAGAVRTRMGALVVVAAVAMVAGRMGVRISGVMLLRGACHGGKAEEHDERHCDGADEGADHPL